MHFIHFIHSEPLLLLLVLVLVLALVLVVPAGWAGYRSNYRISTTTTTTTSKEY